MNERLLSPEDVESLKNEFKDFINDVDIKLIKGEKEGEYTQFTINFINELMEISPKIKLEILGHDSDIVKKENIISFPHIFIGYDLGYRIEFMGSPIGYEAKSFIQAVKMVSTGISSLSEKAVEIIKTVSKPTLVQVFVTPSCPYCIKSVMLAFSLAFENKNIKGVCVESEENTELAKRFSVTSVPQQVLNEDYNTISVGVQQEMKFVNQIINL